MILWDRMSDPLYIAADAESIVRAGAWLAGGTRRWRVAPDVMTGGWRVIDRTRVPRSKGFATLEGAFTAIELAERVEASNRRVHDAAMETVQRITSRAGAA